MKTSSLEIRNKWPSVKKIHLGPINAETHHLQRNVKLNCFQLQIMFLLQTLIKINVLSKAILQLCYKKIVWNWVECFVRFIIWCMLNFIDFWHRICKLLWWVVPLNQCFWKIICLIKGRHCLAKKKNRLLETWVFEKRFLPYTCIFTLHRFNINSV